MTAWTDPELASILDRFEEAWQQGTPPEIQAFLPPQANDDHEHLQHQMMLAELISIDLEHRWRQCHKTTKEPQPGAEDARFSTVPRLEEYLARHPQLRCSKHLLTSLIAHEFRVRQLWGDRPTISEFRSYFAGPDPPLEQELHKVLTELSRVSLKIYDQQQLVFTTDFEGSLEIGRQRLSEPAPFAQLSAKTGPRLIIVPHEHVKISRRHVQLERQTESLVHIKNLTVKSSFAVIGNCHDFWGTQLDSLPVRPGAELTINLPVLILIKDITVRLEAQA